MPTHSLSHSEKYYLLGLIWADGHIATRRVELYGSVADLEPLRLIIVKLLPNIYDRQRKNWKPARLHYSCDKSLHSGLKRLGFINKSKISPEFPQSPTEIRNFIKGYFDGDGSVNISKGQKNRQLNFSGSYEQDWSFVEKVFDSLGIVYKISRIVSKTGYKQSMIRTCGRTNINAFFKYIYPRGFDFGFKRKYDKFQQVLK